MLPRLLALVVMFLSTTLFAEQNVRLVLPDYRGAVMIRTDDDLKLAEASFRPDGSGIRTVAHGKGDVFVTIFVQKAEGSAEATAVRSQWWSDKVPDGVKRGKVESSERDGHARIEYTNESYKGAPVQQRNRHEYLAGGQVWVEVHMSKVKWTANDQGYFDEVLSHITLEPDYTATSADAWLYGSQLFQAQQFGGAAKVYSHALELEKRQPSLDPVKWHVLIDNLGMAYGITGDLKRAKEVFDYGISKDEKYPMFYYDLACVAGEQNDLEGTIKNLQLAFERRANVLPSEKMPDPMKDDSFQRFVKDKRFQDAVAALPKS
jgi:tetratricopeptide (TPR) repeat protein